MLKSDYAKRMILAGYPNGVMVCFALYFEEAQQCKNFEDASYKDKSGREVVKCAHLCECFCTFKEEK